MRHAQRLDALAGAYAFAELDRLCAERRADGVDVIDFGVGDPTDPTPDVIVNAARDGLERHRRSGYPSYRGGPEFRAAAAAWIARREACTLDPDTQLLASLGSKEAIMHLPLAFVQPGDTVLLPSPGYPPYARGAALAGGRVQAYSVNMEGSPLPDLDALELPVDQRLALVWITQPHVPTGRAATVEELRRLAEQCRERGALLCSDEAYIDLWREQPPPSALRAGCDNVLVFHSLSKRAAMTGYRVGFVAGDARAIDALGRLKTNIDSGTPHFIQDAAIAALSDETAPAAARAAYAARADALVPGLRAAGCAAEVPAAGFYVWAAAPEGSGVDFAKRLLAESPGLAALPGEWLADPVSDQLAQPGDGRVRFALVPSLTRCEEAAARLAAW
ncbi:MAG: LL-diaminopimelate aminotransferase [Planctomycetota bacterium]|nr:MAG: LL-diaminopimelate aminotransferase [Planctomycetota bacterium]